MVEWRVEIKFFFFVFLNNVVTGCYIEFCKIISLLYSNFSLFSRILDNLFSFTLRSALFLNLNLVSFHFVSSRSSNSRHILLYWLHT